MHKNIFNVTSKEIPEIIREATATPKTRVIEIDGKSIGSSEDYYKFIEKELSFPRPCESMVTRYLDWIRDLSWFDYEAYYFIIYDSSYFLSDDPEGKKGFFSTFTEYILPWWEKDVLQCVVDGKTKIFKIYLVT